MSDWYALDENKNVVGPVELTKLTGLGKIEDRRVARTIVYDGCEVSTVFLGLDHRFSGVGRPIVFETLVFGGPFDGAGERYCTWAEAEAGHAKYVDKCQPILTEGE
jgi:hypothetical protein